MAVPTPIGSDALRRSELRNLPAWRPRRPPDLMSTGEWHAVTLKLRLSPRESQMVRVAFYDESVTVMAQNLGISEHTVHTYRERVFRKLGVNTFCQVLSTVFFAYLAVDEHARSKRVPSAGDTRATDTQRADLFDSAG